MFWYEDSDPSRHNPCGSDMEYVPESASQLDLIDAVSGWLVSEGVSGDYVYLMLAESSGKVDAVSKKGAVGIWQMMPRTMKAYGCSNYRDIECQTRAAARYIKHLESFIPKEHVIEAWNMGGHNFLKHGATKEAKGLKWKVKMIKKG